MAATATLTVCLCTLVACHFCCWPFGCLCLHKGRYGAGLGILLAWSSFAWRRQQQYCSSLGAAAPGAAAAFKTHSGACSDPLITLLLAAVPVDPTSGGSSSSRLSSWAAVLQAGLYEGAVGATALILLGGRWCLWLLLWEAWVAWVSACMFPSTSTNSSSTAPAAAPTSSMQKAESASLPQDGRPSSENLSTRANLACWTDELQVPPGFAVTAAAAATNTAAAVGAAAPGVHAGRLSGMHMVVNQHTGLAVLHLVLPVVLAAAGLWL